MFVLPLLPDFLRREVFSVFDFLVSTAASVLGGIIAFYVCKAIEDSKKQ